MTTQRTGSNPVRVDADSMTLLRLRRIGRELRLTDQILSIDLDTLAIVDRSRTGAPAWTSPDGSTITIDATKMPVLHGRRNVAVWLGTNAHELFHNLYTPRRDSLLMQRIESAERTLYPGIFRCWNILEDQRIERLGLNRYAAWRGYLIAALRHHIPVTHPEAWTLVAGRTWLGDEVRKLSRAAFVAANDEGTARLAESLIGEYQRLTDPGVLQSGEAFDLVVRFWDAFGQKLPPKVACGSEPIAMGEPEEGDESTPVHFPAADEYDEPDDDDDELDDDEPDDDEPVVATNDEPDDDEADDESEADGDEADDESEADGDTGDAGDESSESESDGDEAGDEAGDDGMSDEGGDDDDEHGDGTSGPSGQRTVSEALRDDVDEALNEQETADDLDRVVDQVYNGKAGAGDLPRSTGRYVDVTDKARWLARDVSEVLSNIKDDNEAAWIRRTDTGRFNVSRWATDPDWDADNVFDEFRPGAMDASSLDVVLVLDVSGSMSGAIHRLAESTWAIRTAIDRVEGQCTVIGFGDAATLMFDQGQRPDGRLFIPNLEGSTNPTPACREAHHLVAQSTAANRIVVVLTDGQWWDAATAADALRQCQASGAITAVIGLGGHVQLPSDFCKADVVAHIKDPSELVAIFRDLAERSMLAAARR